jgi:PPM family protein phosphatase
MRTEYNQAADEWRAVLSQPLTFEKFQSPAANVELDMAALSDCGKVQSHNSDHYLGLRLGRLQQTLVSSLPDRDLPERYEEYAYAMLVADGLGDDGAGSRASRIALSALAHLAVRYGRWNVRISPEVAAEVRKQGEFFYREVNDAVMRASGGDHRLATMSTSLTAVYIAGTDLFFARAGHSKAFLFRNGTLISLAANHKIRGRDESEPGVIERLRRLMLDQEHVVTEALGGRVGGPNVEIEHVQLWSGDRVVLCTNGLTDVVPEDEIANVLALRRHPMDDCRRLIDLALSAGGPDNVTVMTADYRIRSPYQ